MGQLISKQEKISPKLKSEMVFNEKYLQAEPENGEGYLEETRGLKLLDINDEATNPISCDSLGQWESALLSEPKNKLAQNSLAKFDIANIVGCSDTKTKVRNQHFFNTEVKTIGAPSFNNNQKKSGRCWIFATANVLRAHVIENYNLKDDKFQLSQSYLFFYDKLEKANILLENILDTADEPLDSRLVQFLLHDPVGDGGQWDMIVNIINKYGLVPYEFFPDNAQSTESSRLNYVVTEKLREYALILRSLKSKKTADKDINLVKNSMIREIYNILSLTIGTPPKPTDSFVWEFKDKDGNYKYFNTTPQKFYAEHVKFDVGNHFSLIHDPRNPYNKLYTVDRLNNVHGGKPIEYVNTEIATLKKVSIKMLKNNEPIFFGSDVAKFYDRDTGILDVGAYDYALALGTSFKISKAERLKTGSSQMTHAMVITGVHLDPITGNPVRWKIENSWGDLVGDKGYFLMTDKWFDEYVYQIVTNKNYVEKQIYEVWKGKDFTVLPFYDPMGSLA
ncbi:uncharacterized protein AC631_04560 [Debaryomyces fabryi]|uniref:Cysteine proteinase 1, mitochondrial n=1 Tax=Debaryomyces fabryi TaxID=58627 RepID=A0A0V1PUD0_9ASCO|nr:uncharacterized protein AC631_04560 [Debaryomyces fabryi]KRZ99684.1 hypothetical protein AC631_04560 [Debaryomyces fabryi]CUM45866.1 unnamed protein product [Debaryomyces fabryi]